MVIVALLPGARNKEIGRLRPLSAILFALATVTPRGDLRMEVFASEYPQSKRKIGFARRAADRF